MATISDIYRKAVDSGVLSNKVSEERFAQMLQNDNERKAYWEYANQKKPGFYSSDYNMFSQNASALLSAKPAQQFNEPADLSGVLNQADSQNMQDGNQAPSIQNQHTTPAGFRTVDTSQPVLDPDAGQREVFMMGEPDEQRRQQLETYERKRAANMPQMEQMWANDAKRFDEIMAEAETQGAQAAGQVAAEYGNAYQYTGMPGGTRLAVRGEMQAAANKETDPDKIAGRMMDEILARYEKQQEIETKRLIREGLSAKEENANLSEDELNQLVNQTYDNIKSQPIEQLQQEAGVDDSDMAIYAEYVQEQMRNRFMDKYTPQDNWEYFARKVAEGNLLGQAVGAMIETPAQRAYKMQGTQRYASGNNTTWLDLGAEATNIVTDPTMYFFPAAGHAAANFGVRKLATSALTRKGVPYAAQVAERQLLQRGSWNAASRLLGGSLGFMGIDVAHDIAGQMYMPVYNEKTGKYEEGAYDAMQTVGAAGKGAVMGAAFGLSGLMGDTVQRSVGQAYGKTIGAVAGKGTHYAMGTNLMFGSDVMSRIAQGTPIEDIDFGEAYRHAAMTQLFFDLWGGAKQFSANRNIRQKDGSVQHLSFRDAVRLGWNQTKDPYSERFTFTNEELEQLNKYINGGNNQEILLNLNSKGRTDNEDWLNDFYKQLNAVFTDPEVDTQTKYKLAYLLSGEDVRGNVRPIHVGKVEDIGGGKYQVRTYDNSAQAYSTRRFNSLADARRYEAEQQDITKTNKMYWLEGIAATYGFAKAFDGLTNETIEKTMQNYPQLTEADARRILTTAKKELSPIERAIKGRMESYLSKEVKGQEFVKFLRQELATKNGISEQAVNNILSKDYSELNRVEKAIFDDYLDRLTQEMPLEKEVREQKRAIEAGGGIPAEPVEPTQPTREDVIRQEVTDEVASQTHKNGYVYPVKQAGESGKIGFVVGGEVVVDTTDPSKPRISNDDIVTVKYEDGTIEQVSARMLDLVSTPEPADNVIAGMVEQRLAAEAQQAAAEQVAQNLPEGVVEFTNGQQILLAKDNGDGTYVVLDEQGNPQSGPMPLQDYIDSGYRPKEQAQPVQPEPAQPVAPQEPAQPIQPAQPAEPIQPEPQAPDVNSNTTPEEFAAQMTEYMGSPRIARGFLLAEQKKIEAQLKQIENDGVKDYTDAADYRAKAQQLEQTRQALQTQLDKINSSIAVIEQQEQAAQAQAQAEAEAAAKAEAERLAAEQKAEQERLAAEEAARVAAEQKAAEEQRLAAEQHKEQPEAQVEQTSEEPVEQTPAEKPEPAEIPEAQEPQEVQTKQENEDVFTNFRDLVAKENPEQAAQYLNEALQEVISKSGDKLPQNITIDENTIEDNPDSVEMTARLLIDGKPSDFSVTIFDQSLGARGGFDPVNMVKFYPREELDKWDWDLADRLAEEFNKTRTQESGLATVMDESDAVYFFNMQAALDFAEKAREEMSPTDNREATETQATEQQKAEENLTPLQGAQKRKAAREAAKAADYDLSNGSTPSRGKTIDEYLQENGVDTSIPAMTEAQYLASVGLDFMGYSEPALHKGQPKTLRQRKKRTETYHDSMVDFDKRREDAKKEYQQKLAKGEIRIPTKIERLMETAKGHPDNQSVQSARRLLEKRGIDWESGTVNAETGSPMFSITDRKQAQFDLVQAYNPMTDDVHTGIRSVDDIHTLEETMNDSKLLVTEPDWEEEDIKRAVESGEVTIYSSYPIENGVFVTPSRMMAEDYAGDGEVYSKTVPVDKVAWIASDEGQYADVDELSNIGTRLTESEQLATDALLEVLQDNESVNLHVATDEEARKFMEEEAQKKSLNETATWRELMLHTNYAADISSNDGAKVLKNIETTKQKLEKSSNLTIKDPISVLSHAIGLQKTGLSYYGTFKTGAGNVVTLRISNHNATVSNFDNMGEAEGISIVITPQRLPGITNDGAAHIIEYYYRKNDFANYYGKPLAEILGSIKGLLEKGEYVDTTGLAQVEEVNVPDQRTAQLSFSNASEEIFFSNAERAVESIKQEKATPAQWLAMIEKAGGLKAGEDKWIGLSEWLKAQHATVEMQPGETRSQYIVRLGEASKKFTIAKQDILDYIRQNKIQIEEVEYGEYDMQDAFEGYRREYKQYYDEAVADNAEDPQEVAWQRMIDEHGDDFDMGFYAYGDELQWDADSDYVKWELENSGESGLRPIDDTRMRYTTHGLQNKREIALTVPTIESWNEDDEIHFGDAGEGRAIAWVRFGDAQIKKRWADVDQAFNELGEYSKQLHAKYGRALGDLIINTDILTDEEKKHWDELDAKRKAARDSHNSYWDLTKVLVIDEIQSKRHQEGRERGYDEFDSVVKEVISKFNVNERRVREEPFDVANAIERYDADLADRLRDQYNRHENYAIPAAAPFEKNWHELAMKRILRFAAENGYDKVAWTTGDQQARRYDLSSEVQSIDIEPSKEIEGQYRVITHGTNGRNIDAASGNMTEEQVLQMFGKDLGKRLLDGIKQQPWGYNIQGEGLRIGGDGMKGFYDEMLPRFMQKYGKKWGVQVGEVTMPDLEEGYQTMHSIDITPEMRESVLQGQPMFMRTPKGVLYGWAVGNNVYLTKDGLNPRSPIHEYSHLWVESVKQHNSELYDNLKDLFSRENLPDMWKQLDKEEQYSDLSEDGKLSEIISRFSERGGKRMEEEARRMMDEAKKKGKKAVANTSSLIQRMKNALKRLWDWVGEHLFNIKNFGSREEAADRILYDMINKTDLQLDEERTNEDVQYSFNEEKQKIMADWHEQNPHPKYEEGEDLEHYRERLEAWKKSYDEMRGQTKGMPEEPKVEQPTSAETTAEPIQPELLGPRELIRKFEAMNSVRMSPESVQARNRMIGNMRALRDQLHRLREAEASEVGAITGEIEQGVRDRQLALRAEYEKSAQMITDLAKDLFRGKVFLGMTDMDFSKMLTNIREASTKYDLQKNIEIMEDIVQRVQGRYLKASQNALNDAATIMTQRRNRVGVDIGRWVDPIHHVMISSFDKLRNTSIKHIDNVLADLNAQLNAETSETELDLLASKIAGAERARAYREQLDQLESDLTNLDLDIHQLDRYVERNNLRGNKRKEFMEQRRALMRERMDKMDELILLNDRTVDELSGITKDGRSDFIERIKKKQERKIEVLRLASRDLAGIRDDKGADDQDKGGLKDMYLSPLRTFTHELRKFGTHSAGGEGYLYSYFAPLAHDARSNYLLHIRERMEILDAKAKELFGEKATWDSVMNNVSNKVTDVEKTWKGFNETERVVNSAGVQKTVKKEPEYLTNGQIMYIYMVNKMTDGKVKLGHEGITEDVVAALTAQLPKELVKLADWLQEEYFPMTRKRYNATNIFLYDTPMAEIPNYVPLKISGDAIEPQTDIQQGKVKLLPSNVVGSAISRTYNRKPIDIRNTDAMDLVVQNMKEMEHWSAYAELITDLNTLLNNLSFKNRIEQMNPNNYDNFYKTCQLVVEQYRPDVGPADALVAGLTRFIATSKISLRWWTALKQRLSAISPLSEADPEFHKQYAKAYFHCKDNFQWAMENLPIFRERWESKQGGNEKLNIAEINSKSQEIQDMLEWAQENLVKFGISANAFVDAITCANMAKAQYETKKKYYTERGYSPEAVESLAKWKADEIYNETQQSSEGAYISAMQRDRTFVSSAISLFNNSSMAYTRKNAEALREIYKIAVGDKQAFIDFRKEQLMKDGMAEDQAAEFAETDYKRARTHAIADAAINGYIIQFVWNYGGKAFKTLLAVLPFLLMGDDDEKKKAKEELLKDLKKDAVVSTIQPVRGLPFGGTFDTSLGVVYDIATGQTERRYMSKTEVAGKIASNMHPSIDDISKLLSSLTRKEIDEMEFASYLVNIATASGTSIDAQTLANILWGLEDLTENTFEGKLTLADVRNDLSIILNAPPSQIEYMILQPHKGETKRQFIERYTEYIKLKKYGILTPFADDPELSADRKKKAADAFRKK